MRIKKFALTEHFLVANQKVRRTLIFIFEILFWGTNIAFNDI